MKKTKVQGLYNRLCACGNVLGEADLTAAARVMASAFSGDDSIRYLLGGVRMGSQDWKYFLCVLKAVYGKCVMLSGDEGIRSLLILFPPKLKAVPALSFLVNGGIGLYRIYGIGLLLRSLRYERNCRMEKRRNAPRDAWYCMCFAVSPEMQGQGVGAGLIRPVLELLEQRNIPLYLETHSHVNVSFYEHLGLETVGTTTIPGTKIRQYLMLKKR